MECTKASLEGIEGECLGFAYERDLGLKLIRNPPKELSNYENYVLTYIICIGKDSKGALYVVSNSRVAKCVGDDVNELLNRLVFINKESLLNKRKESSINLSELIRGD